jgi:type VI secretion system protein ImpA
VADYLHGIEPHSPTPYLLRRAVKWGDMTLADIVKEVAQQGHGSWQALLELPEGGGDREWSKTIRPERDAAE